MVLVLWNSRLIPKKSRLQLLYLVLALRNCSTSNTKSTKHFPSYKSIDSACLIMAMCWNIFRLHHLCTILEPYAVHLDLSQTQQWLCLRPVSEKSASNSAVGFVISRLGTSWNDNLPTQPVDELLITPNS